VAPRRKTISARNRRNTEVIELDFDGTVFPCKPSIPGVVLLDFIGGIDEDTPATMAVALRDLLFSAVEEDHLEDFKTYISKPENGVDIEALSEAVGYLVEQYSDRPTNQPG
jgi:hypothetical protein